MEALDGNAIAGVLMHVFGTEMTTAAGACAHCAATGLLAEQMVYNRAPGTVVRCRSCTGVLMVLVDVRGIHCVDLRGLLKLEPTTTWECAGVGPSVSRFSPLRATPGYASRRTGIRDNKLTG